MFDCTLTGGRQIRLLRRLQTFPKSLTQPNRKLLQSAKRPPVRVAVRPDQRLRASTDPEPAGRTRDRRARDVDGLLAMPVDHQRIHRADGPQSEVAKPVGQ